MKKKLWLGALAVLPASVAISAAWAGEPNKPPRPFPKYTVEVIYGLWCGVTEYEPISGRSISAAGVVAGQLTACPQNKEAFLYPAGAGPGALFIMPRPPGFSNAYGAAVNDLNWLVGRITQSGVNQQGFVYKPDGSLTLIPPPPEGNWCEALGVNNAGVAVGFWMNNVTGPLKAFYWQNGIRTDLTELPGPDSKAQGISPSGLITGWTGIAPSLASAAFTWNDGHVTLLPPVPGGVSSDGYAINDCSDVCGRGRVNMTDGSWKWRAFASIDGEMIAIPPLPGFTDHTSALGINSHRQVVGGSGAGFIWQDGVVAKLTDLLVNPPPGLGIGVAKAIGEDARIVADCNFASSGDALTCLLTPVLSDPADLDGDGLVNTADAAILLAAWGQCRQVCPADLDGNGVVNGFDLALLLASWTS